MSGSRIPIHFVCTRDEAAELIAGAGEFWVCDCGCREGRGTCARSRHDVCLMFGDTGASGSWKRRIGRSEAEAILETARSCGLVARPFRNDARTAVEGICFCCDDCCGYFLNPAETCDRGRLIEHTSLDGCSHCRACEDACFFGARRMENGELRVDRALCYGCGICADVCPGACVGMVQRTG